MLNKDTLMKLEHRDAKDYAEQYDSKNLYTPFWRAVDDIILKKWLEKIVREMLVLDLGCGTGRCLLKLAQKGVNAVGIDISPFMINKSKEKLKRYKQQIDLIICDAENLPFNNASFDVVISYGTLHHLPSISKALCEVSRVLKDRGLFMAYEAQNTPLKTIFDIFSLLKLIKPFVVIFQKYFMIKCNKKIKKSSTPLSSPSPRDAKRPLKEMVDSVRACGLQITLIRSSIFPIFHYYRNRMYRNYYGLSYMNLKLGFILDKHPLLRGKGGHVMIEGYKSNNR
ncbi:MAG: class I SAM-dependent methyltransferase [Nitrososphaerota archaeon]|nr:class I SAM-dependent methyltransferase [Nitrososphaerota archaeon]